MLRGEDLDALSRELGVTAGAIAQWRDQFLAGGQAAVRQRPADERDDEIARLRAKVGELTMDNELLRERARRAEGDAPFRAAEVEDDEPDRLALRAAVPTVWRASAACWRSRARRSTPPAPAAGGRCPPGKRGPKTAWTDAELTERIRQVLAASPFVGEGYRKVWARLRPPRVEPVRTSKARVLRLMRAAGLLAPTRVGTPHGPKAHDGTIIPEAPDVMWGTDATGCLTGEGHATIFFAVDHFTAECVGIHAARRGTRFEALEPLRQGVRTHFGGLREATSPPASRCGTTTAASS